MFAAVTRETQEEHPWNGQSRNTFVPRFNEENITQVSEEIKSSVTEKLSQEFSRTESLILGALSKLDDFLLNPQIRTHSGTIPGTFRNTNVENQWMNEDDSQSDPHPEAGIFRSQTTQNSGPEVGHDTTPVWKAFFGKNYPSLCVLYHIVCFFTIFKNPFFSNKNFFPKENLFSYVFKNSYFFIRILWQICYNLVVKNFHSQESRNQSSQNRNDVSWKSSIFK